MAGPEVRRFVSTGPGATEALAERVGRGLGPGAVVALDGELGAGKTTWVRGLARGLGVRDPVSSPTYCLMQEYEGRLALHHFDAWMSGREEAFLEEGGGHYLGGEGVAVVEWAERVAPWLPVPRLAVRLAPLGLERRSLEIALVRDPRGGGEESAPERLLEGLLRSLPAAGRSSDGSTWREEPRAGDGEPA